MTTTGIPVRLSAGLTVRARMASRVCDRSMTDQVEHWARLGQVVEAAIAAPTTQHLKALSHDRELGARLAAAKTPKGQAHAAALIRERDPVVHGVDEAGTIVRVARRGNRTPRSKP